MSTVITAAPQSATKPSRSQRSIRINWRIVLLLAVAVLPFLYFGWVVVSQTLNHGITRNGRYLEVDLKALGNFPFHQERGTIDDVPAHFRDLDGKRVLLKGFMFTRTSAGDRGQEFEFVYNVNRCCFDGAPQVQERVFAFARTGDIQLYNDKTFVRLTGTLHVRVL